MEKYQIAKEQEVYKSKIGFFINLVHEIRTPLSLIRLPLEKLQEIEHEGKEAKYLSVIDKNVNYLFRDYQSAARLPEDGKRSFATESGKLRY